MTKKLAPCMWKKPRPAFDRRTLKAVQRWLRAAALAHSKERERYEKDRAKPGHDALIYGEAKAAVALRNMARVIDERLRDLQ